MARRLILRDDQPGRLRPAPARARLRVSSATMKQRSALALLFIVGCATGGVAAQLVTSGRRGGPGVRTSCPARALPRTLVGTRLVAIAPAALSSQLLITRSTARAPTHALRRTRRSRHREHLPALGTSTTHRRSVRSCRPRWIHLPAALDPPRARGRIQLAPAAGSTSRPRWIHLPRWLRIPPPPPGRYTNLRVTIPPRDGSILERR